VSTDRSGTDAGAHAAVLLDPREPSGRAMLDELRADQRVAFLDEHEAQENALRRLRPEPDDAVLAEGIRWTYYPWRRAVVAVLGPRGFRALRLDRNRNMITAAEQARLGTLRIGVAGLSVGHVIAHTLAAQGLCGELRLADFDELELSNLNRVPATVFDLGVNKATVTARRIAELDPYLPVRVLDAGLTYDTVDEFLDGLDVVVEECDSLEMKAVVREGAKARGTPVVMATSDRGLVDVERFDLDPQRPILHGLLGELDLALLPGMSNRDKIPHMLRHLDAERLSPRTAASLVEVDHSLSTWPQLAGDVTLGATALAEAVRRIGLGEPLGSGRTRIDVGRALDNLREPEMAGADTPADAEPQAEQKPSEITDVVAAAAIRAPSGGNVQPWYVDVDEGSVTIRVAPEFTSAMDVELRGSAVAVGAALFNARVAAAARGRLGPASVGEDNGRLAATLRFGHDADPELAALYQPMLERETNRRHGEPRALSAETVAAMHAVANRYGARLSVVTDRSDIAAAATILAAADRTRYLTARLHAEMFSELRWPGDPDPDTGIDVRSLELDPGDYAVMGILRRPEVMAHLAEWNAGSALGDDTRDRVQASSGLAVVSVTGHELADFARGGSAMEAVWITAQQHGLAVQPVSPVFLYARTPEEFKELSGTFGDELATLQSQFRALVGTESDAAQILVLRLANSAPTSVKSRRDLNRLRLRKNSPWLP
jgi:molybdopterin/thiamine biosynthesis adenylyltransferase